MAIPFNPPPPDEYSLRRLHELVEELYVLIVCHLMSNEQAVKPPEHPRRRGGSCTDDEKNASLNIKRDGGDSDSDLDSCPTATTATSTDSVFAEVAAELNRVQQEGRRHPGDLVTYMRKLSEGHHRPSGSRTPSSGLSTSGTPLTPCQSCPCQGGRSRGWRSVGDPMTSSAYSPDPSRNSEMDQGKSRLGSILSIFRRSLVSTTLSATVACFIGYRLFCCTNSFNIFYP